MGDVEVLDFLVRKHILDPGSEFSIKDMARALEKNGDPGSTERNIRRAVIRLEAKDKIKGDCKGKGDNWRRYYKFKI